MSLLFQRVNIRPLVFAYSLQTQKVLSRYQQFTIVLQLVVSRLVLSVNLITIILLYFSKTLQSSIIYKRNRIRDSSDLQETPIIRLKGFDISLLKVRYNYYPLRQLYSYYITYIGNPQFYSISSSYIQLTLSKALVISSYRSDTIVLQSQVVCTTLVTRYIANSVDYPLQFLVQPSRSNYYNSIASVIHQLITPSIIFSTILRRDISLQPLVY